MTQPFEIQVVGGPRARDGSVTDLYIRVGMNCIGPLSDDEAIALAVALRQQTVHRPLPHPNGGGLVDQTATVATAAFVGPRARVCGAARVIDTARIEDDAVVSDASVVSGEARVSGNARVSGTSKISGEAHVSGFAKVRDATVMGVARVRGHASVSEGAIVWATACVLDRAVVTRRARVGSWCVVGGDAVVDELADISGGMRIGGRAHLGRVQIDGEPLLVLGFLCTSPWLEGVQTYLLPNQLGAIDPSAPPVPIVPGLLAAIDGDASARGHGWYRLTNAVLKLAGDEGKALALHYGPWLAAALITYRATGVPPESFRVLGLALPKDTCVPRTLRAFAKERTLPDHLRKAITAELKAAAP